MVKAEDLAKKQKEIGVAEFFAKNKHLLGFDNKRKSLMTTIKEAVDNSLDACEEARILPEIIIEVVDMGNDRVKVIIEDNGPGIVKAQIPKIFAKLLYGSKFHSMKQSRGQQGIGISAAVMYGQLTTGRAAKITSKVGEGKDAHYYELKIDTQKNAPEILKDNIVEWDKVSGTKIEVDIEATYQKGLQSIDEYLKETAIANSHATIIYTNPKAEQIIFPRVSEELPVEPKEIKPHPYGVELGILMNMLKFTTAKTLQQFLTTEFARIGSGTAKQICENGALLPKTKPAKMSMEMTEKLMEGIKKTRLINPPTDCISPIGQDQLEKGLRKEINAEFYASVSRSPVVYRGNPFSVEAAIAYGGELKGDEAIRVIRFANRVPLLYQQGACAVTKAITQTGWRSYGLSQSSGNVPIGPCVVTVHIASVWVPFTSESKEAIAHYPEIIKEIKLALQEIGRKLASYVRKRKSISDEAKKRSYIEKYIPHMAIGLKEILNLKDSEENNVIHMLEDILEKKRGTLENLEVENEDYDEDFAKIGKEEKEDEQKEE